MSFMSMQARNNVRILDKGTGPEMSLGEWLEQNRGAAGNGQGLLGMSLQSSQGQTKKKKQTGGTKAKSVSTREFPLHVLAKKSRLGG
jgi:hypothetical protein